MYRIKDFINSIKWAWQRAYRGYDDTAYWNLDSYIADIAVKVLPVIRDEKGGFMSDHDYVGSDGWKEGWLTEEKQKQIFDDMIFSMEYHVNDMEHTEKHLGKNWTSEQYDEYHKKVKHGMHLFAEYFGGLWT